MLESAYDIGKTVLERNDLNPVDALYQSPGVTHLILLRLSVDNTTVVHHSLDIVEYDADRHLKQYPYWKPPSSGSGVVPTVILNTSSPLKTISKKIKGWFYKRRTYKELPLKEVDLYLSNNGDEIAKEVQEQVNEVSSSNNNPSFLITVEFSQPELNVKFHKYVVSNLLNGIFKEFYDKYNVISRGESECFFCGDVKEVYGFASPYSFYTHDKVTYASGFDRTTTWRNFPVCGNCAITSKKGSEYIEAHLKFRFYGISYLLFPKVIQSSYLADLLDLLEETYSSDSSEGESSRRVSLASNNLTDDEEEILENLTENDYMTLTFLFFQMNNSQFEILHMVNDVLPSRLSTLFQKKEEIETRGGLKMWWDQLPWKDNSANEFIFTYKFLRDIFPKAYPGEGGKQDIYRAQFLSLAAASLKKDRIESSALLVPIARIMQYLMANFNEMETKIYHFAMKSLVLYEFFISIGCVSAPRSEINMNEILKQLQLENTQLPKAVLKIVSENHYFDHPAKTACFITGILVHQVGRVQWKDLGSTPFYEKLDGLKLTPRKVKRIFSEAIGKLIEYGNNISEMKGLEALASYFFIKEGVDLPNDDLCFSVGLGFSFGSAIWSGYQKKGDENND